MATSERGLHVVQNTFGWGLCPKAEPRLQTAIDTQQVVFINRVFVYKTVGRHVGLSIAGHVTETGDVIEPGQWYSMLEYRQNPIIADAIAKNRSDVTLPSSSWVFLRELDTRVCSLEEVKKAIS